MIKLTLLFWMTAVYGENPASPWYESDFYQSYVEYAVNSNHLSVNYPLNQPYFCHELLQAVNLGTGQGQPVIERWNRLLVKDIYRFYKPDSNEKETGQWHLGVEGNVAAVQDEEKNYGRSGAAVYGTFSLPYVVLVHRTVSDQNMKHDPLYHGDTGEWLQGRPETAYVLFRYRALDFFAGRISRNFGIGGEPGLILSDNPYSFDHAGFSLSAKKVRFSFYTTRLNDMNSIDVQNDSVYAINKRYWVIQRGDIMLRDNLHLGLAQAATYGGRDRTFESYFLNPMGLYYVMQRNNKSQLSGFWAVDIRWKPASKWTLYGQFLIDDIIVNNETGQNDRAKHPDRLGVLVKTILCDPAGLTGVQLFLSYARVWNWTYTSYRSFENYIYYQKSMGYPQNAVENIRLSADVFSRPPFIFHLEGGYKRHGDVDLLLPFGDTKDPFPLGVVEYRGWSELRVDWMPSPHFYTRASVRYESIMNENNQTGREREYFRMMIGVGVRGDVGF
ncbi:hypothetical protein JW935_12660 [candidate division KSB1 bacterium]|nr:hypothetical protein [candidate division KSB1 bacterium]